MKITNILMPVTFSILLSSCAGLYSPNTAQVVDGTNNTNTNVSNQLLVNNQVQLGKPEIISHHSPACAPSAASGRSTSSTKAIGALSPTRKPIFRMRV